MQTTTLAMSPAIDTRRIETATPEERLEMLRRAIGDSLESIRAAARILAAMEAAGDDLSAVPAHMLRMLRRINAEQLLPDVMVRLSGRLRQKVALLPLPDQRRMVDPEAAVEVALADGDKMLIHPQRLTPEQVAQVFGDGYIRSVAEQRALMQTKGGPAPAEAPKGPGRPRGSKTVEIDKERGGVTHYGHWIPKSTLVRWLSEL